jgi:hypothetical protein
MSSANHRTGPNINPIIACMERPKASARRGWRLRDAGGSRNRVRIGLGTVRAFVRLRPALLLLAALRATTACSTVEPPSADDASAAPPAVEASANTCAAAGGTCVSFETSCPVLQQNTVLCADSVMVCCLPPDGGGLFVPPGPEGGADEASAPGMDSGGGTSPVDGSSDAPTG